MKITNLDESVIFDFGSKKYTGAKGFTSVKLVGEIFYVQSVESNNKFNIKFSYNEVSLPKTNSALDLHKLLNTWVRSSTVGSTTITVDDDYLYFTTPNGTQKRIAGSRATT